MFNPNHPNHRKHPNHPNLGRGFTIGEMTIVIAIMAILGTIGFRTYFAERDRFEFNNALIKTMQLIKTVRTYATTSYPIYVDSAYFKGNIIPLNGYGIKAELSKVTKQFTLTTFANVDTESGTGSARYQNDDDPQKMDDNDIMLETYTLPKQISSKYFYFDDTKKWSPKTQAELAGPNAFIAYMIFKPPLGDMTLIGIEKDNPSPIALNELGFQFQNPSSEAAGSKKCQKIVINKVKMFPELIYEPEC